MQLERNSALSNVNKCVVMSHRFMCVITYVSSIQQGTYRVPYFSLLLEVSGFSKRMEISW